jgi:hypothetical protein
MLQRVACAAGLAGRALSQLGSNGQLAQQATTAAAVGAQQVFQRLGFATNSHDIFNVHRESTENNWNTEFDFTEANYKKVSTSSEEAWAFICNEIQVEAHCSLCLCQADPAIEACHVLFVSRRMIAGMKMQIRCTYPKDSMLTALHYCLDIVWAQAQQTQALACSQPSISARASYPDLVKKA